MKADNKLNRREVMVGLGLTALWGCAGSSNDRSSPPLAGSDASPEDRDASTDGEMGAETGSPSSNPWATGGTAAMSGKYTDPFASGLGELCSLTSSLMLGPCYEPTTERKDISEGQEGLPTRMSFVVVDDACNPIEKAEVDIWHAAPSGMYSGSEVPAMCTLGDTEAAKSRYFRGRQYTDAEGRVDFDTCFPGWYPGRTVHIHFTVRVNGKQAVTSQLGFDDLLVDEIVATQPIYKDRGPRDTTNQTDGIITGQHVFEAERQADGALLAWKALSVKLPA